MNPKLKKKLVRKVRGAWKRAWFYAAMKKHPPPSDVRVVIVCKIHSIRY